MPYLKGNHPDATRIHEEYQSGKDQRAFLKSARSFLERIKNSDSVSVPPPPPPPPTTTSHSSPPQGAPSASVSTLPPVLLESSAQSQPTVQAEMRPDPPGSLREHPVTDTPQRPAPPSHSEQQQQQPDDDVGTVGQRFNSMLLNNEDLVVPSGFPSGGGTSSNTGVGTGGGSSSIWGSSGPITPPRPATNNSEGHSNAVGPPPSSPWGSSSGTGTSITQQQNQSASTTILQQPHPHPEQSLIPPPPPFPSQESRSGPGILPSFERAPPPAAAAPVPAINKKEAPPPKRLWAHFDEQPGRLVVNGVDGEDPSITLPLGPRQELTAHWSLPIDYLRRHAEEVGSSLDPTNASLDMALQGLTVGLFRRGCTENGQQASIISKEVSSYDYWHDPVSNSIRGKVPYYSPRTPGNVLFRMYWEKNPLHTLATGPCLHVRVVENDFESSVRFILSNFKGRKSNPTSLSSLHSLATVLETPLSQRGRHEGAARAVWGCIQESRKVIDACHEEYLKTSSKMMQLEEKVEKLKKEVDDEEAKSQELSIENEAMSPNNGVDNGDKSIKQLIVEERQSALHEKTRALLSGRASCERKWRDSQLAFAAILKAALSNPSIGLLMRRDQISRMRAEYELWCPLSEEFALPNESAMTWYDGINEMPQNITVDHFRAFQQSRVKMQMRTLGFDVNSMSLEDVLFPRNRNNPDQRSMDPGAVNVFNSMSAAMGQYYSDLFQDEERVVRRREIIRQRTQQLVQECGAFPSGTEVVIFGSSANGFGSPKSDLDMCLHLADGTRLDSERGAEAMAKLAEHFEQAGMHDVDTARLTARIPIIMYQFPDPLPDGDSENLFDCDLSMHNPLAVLNTSLLRSYAEITPVTRVLASIIKRWAKARDINSPARHTLSSYGYIIMLLHFLTYHKRTGTGLVSPVAPPEGDNDVRNRIVPQATPLLPNLQWMDHGWPNLPKGTPYRELTSLPRQMMKHPMKEETYVNTFFYKPKTPNDKAVLQMLFPGQDLSLAIILASFFRYFAYEFDYKRHVVSLHSTAARGIVEREVKAELDGWRNYSAALAIEDPFELEYDVAHVLRGGYYHRIRREFALAYTKIADAASGRPNAWNKGDLRSMSGQDLINWICESVSTEREQGQLLVTS